MVASAFGKIQVNAASADAAIERSRQLIGESQDEARGVSVAGLAKGARAYGLNAQVIERANANVIRAELAKGRLVIAHVVPTYLNPNATTGHYTVVTAIVGDTVYLNDPATTRGPVTCTVAQLEAAIRKRGTYMIVSIAP